MVRRHGLFGFVLSAAASIVALQPMSASAVGPVAGAITQTAVCTATLRVTPVTYTPEPPTSGSFKVRVESSCVGSGFGYADTNVDVHRYSTNVSEILEGDLSSLFVAALSTRDCGAVSSCEMTYSFSGGPYRFSVGGQAWWTSTNGQPWIAAWPVDDSCGIVTGQWSTMACILSYDLLVM